MSCHAGHLHLNGKWTIVSDGGQVWQPYVRTNVWSDFGPNLTTLFGPDSVPLISHGQYMDVDAGFTTKIDTHFSAFAEAGAISSRSATTVAAGATASKAPPACAINGEHANRME